MGQWGRMKKGWLRLRGNASGRNGFGRPKPWTCAGCCRVHGGSVERTIQADGLNYCDRSYYSKRLAPVRETNTEIMRLRRMTIAPQA